MSEESATEAAQVLAKVAAALPRDEAEDLCRLIGHELASRPAGEAREFRLGLLIEMISGSPGEVPTAAAYESFRTTREDERWPSHSMLVTAYGHWLAAVRAATRLVVDGTAARVPSSLHHTAHQPPYSRDEISDSLHRCSSELGEWPTEWEFEEWGALTRQACRNAGLPYPRNPNMKTVRRVFGSYATALGVAKRRFAIRPLSDA